MQLLVENAWVSVETPLPQAVADDRGGWTAEAFFRGEEVATKQRTDAHDGEEAGRCIGDRKPFRNGAGGFGEVVLVGSADGLERGVQLIPILQADGRDEAVRILIARIALQYQDELVADRVGQRAQDDGVEYGKDSAVGADAQS